MTREETYDMVVVGGGLTGLTLAYYLQKEGYTVAVLESNASTGGTIHTVNEGSFTYETGPNTGIIGSAELVSLFDDLHLAFEVANPKASERWVWKKNRWHVIPQHFLSAVTTPLFRFHDKLRIIGEPFRKKSNHTDETIAHMVQRRLGHSFLDYAVDPFIGGIYAGDPETLVTRHALPKLHALEQHYGSFIRGAIQLKKRPKTALEKRVTRQVFSIRGGLQGLILALNNALDSTKILTETSQLQIEPMADGFVCRGCTHGESFVFNAKKVISTVDSLSFPNIFPFLTSSERQCFSSLRFAKVVQVAVGFERWNGKPLTAFGGLVPHVEKKDLLGVLFPSALFSGRAPEGGALLSLFLGGIRRPDVFDMSDNAIRSIVQNTLEEMLQCNDQPDLLRIFRYERAIPQYEQSSAKRWQVIADIEKKHQGLIIAGNLRDGIGMADRVKQAVQLSEKLKRSYLK